MKKVNRPVVHASNNFDDDDMVPKRKQRRVRDPYAIDLSDEDEEDLDLFPPPKPKKEESLIDFLNNYEPPPEPTPKPKPPPTLPKKKSAPSLMTRLRSGGHSASGSFAGLTRRTSNIEARSLHSRASTTKGYTPISVNIPSGSDKLSGKLSDKFGIEPPPPPKPADDDAAFWAESDDEFDFGGSDTGEDAELAEFDEDGEDEGVSDDDDN